jgi:Amt family ammonium transporter
MLFVPLWITFSYVVGCFSLFGGGFLYQLGTLDYSGGYVIHLSSGTAGFVAAILVGPRHPVDRKDDRPNNVLFVMVGAGILWLGWNGFNGGDPYAASPDAGVAVLNTNVCTAMSMLIWVACDLLDYRRPSIIGGTQGMITGLVAITPAAGFIDGWGAIIMGALSGSIPWASYNLIGKRPWFQRFADDTLGVVHTHMVAGVLGGFFTGVFATQDGVLAFGSSSPPGGAIAHYGKAIAFQLAGAGFIIGWNIVRRTSERL